MRINICAPLYLIIIRDREEDKACAIDDEGRGTYPEEINRETYE